MEVKQIIRRAILFGLLLLPQPATAGAQMQSIRPIHLLSSTPETVAIEFTLSGYTLMKAVINGETCTRLQSPALSPNAVPGAPQLPQTGALLGLPPGSTPALHIQHIETTRIPLSHPICPAPSPVPVRTVAGAEPEYEFGPDEAIYSRDAFFPANVAAVTETGWLRDHQVARVTFYPLRYNPARNELEVTRRLVVEIHFAGMNGHAPLQTTNSPGIFENILRGELLNYDQARDWQAAPPAQTAATALNTPATQSGSYKITVEANGLYLLSYTDLQAAGLPVNTLDPRTFQLFENGHEIAIQVEGQDDGRFDPGDTLLFYGQAPRSRYTARNVYWMRVGDETGQRMSTRDVTPGAQPAGAAWTTARWEENIYYDSTLPATDGDHWYAADLRPEADHTTALALMPPAASAPTATLRVRLAGYTASEPVNPDHHALFTVNGHAAGELWWDGSGAVTATLALDRAMLQTGENTVAVSLPGDSGASVEGVWLDSMELDYAFQTVTGDKACFWGQAGAQRYELGGFTSGNISLYDVTDPQRPDLLQGEQMVSGVLSFADDPAQPAVYFALTKSQAQSPVSISADAPSNLRDEAVGADYLIITPAVFAEAVGPLADYRQAQGLSVTVANVQDVYDEFSAGLPLPEAIRDFMAHVTPTYALLVGDGSYDFLDHHGYGPVNALPPYLAMVDPWWGETAADNRYAAVVGDDILPDVLLGRLPVTTAAEAVTIVSKIINYEQSPWLGGWNARHIFVADDADDAGDFRAASDNVYNNFMAAPWEGQKIYLDDLGPETARQETLAAWNRGALLVSFTGHSSWHQWAVEALLDIHDVPDLHNGQQQPVLLSMTCFTGFFHHPEYATLDELLLRLAGGGAAATWSPSGLGVGTGHDHLHQGFYQAVFTSGQTQLGPAILSAKLRLYSQSPAHTDLVETYHLFGDPAMALNLTIRPWPYSTFLPIANKNHSGG